MKSIIKKSVFLLLILLSSGFTLQKSYSQQGNISFKLFYDQLSPYGQWLNSQDYGNIWIPDAGPDFSPYSSRGYWIMTDFGWTWQSEYPWGWAPFHYGRWDFNDSFGWFWVPDYEWGPAWVSWRYSEGYYGWAPMQPGISINLSFGMAYNRGNDHWRFVNERNFGRSNIDRYYVDRRDNERIINNSTVIRNTYVDNTRHTTYVAGPNREDVQRLSGRKVSPVAVQESNVPEQKVRNGRLNIYRPQFQGNKDDDRRLNHAPRIQQTPVYPQPDMRNNKADNPVPKEVNPDLSNTPKDRNTTETRKPNSNNADRINNSRKNTKTNTGTKPKQQEVNQPAKTRNVRNSNRSDGVNRTKNDNKNKPDSDNGKK